MSKLCLVSIYNLSLFQDIRKITGKIINKNLNIIVNLIIKLYYIDNLSTCIILSFNLIEVKRLMSSLMMNLFHKLYIKVRVHVGQHFISERNIRVYFHTHSTKFNLDMKILKRTQHQNYFFIRQKNLRKLKKFE